MEPAISRLAEFMNDENNQVRYSTCWLFSKIAKHCHELLTEEKVFKEVLYPKLIQGLCLKSKEASNIASIISELAESSLNTENKLDKCIFSECFEELTKGLYEMAKIDEPSESETSRKRVSGFSALYNLLQYAPSDCEHLLMDFLPQTIDALKQSLKVKSDESHQELQGFLLCTIQCILTNFEDNMPDEVGVDILMLVLDIFNQRSDVFDEGFLVLSALCNKFDKFMKRNFITCAPYIMHGIKSKNSSLIRNSCGVLSDFCTLVEPEGILEGFVEYIPILLKHLRDPLLDRSAKIYIITVIGDTFLFAKHKFKPFLDETLSILELASESVIAEYEENKKQDQQNYPNDRAYDYEDLQYNIELQSALIECYT